MSVTVFSRAYLDDLVALSVASPRLRQHRNVHADYAEPCQRLFNAIEPASYIQPHRHARDPGREMMMAVRGLMALVVFDEGGNVLEAVKFGVGRFGQEPDCAVGVETSAGAWHTVISLYPGSVLLEVKAGPFDPAQPKEPAPWAPSEGSAEAPAYLRQLKTVVLCHLYDAWQARNASPA
jgi:cupin fold WbuC family metalloprotein